TLSLPGFIDMGSESGFARISMPAFISTAAAKNGILSHSITRQACRPCFIEGTGSIELGKRKSEANSNLYSEPLCLISWFVGGQHAGNQRWSSDISLSLNNLFVSRSQSL